MDPEDRFINKMGKKTGVKLKNKLFKLVKEYYDLVHRPNQTKNFIPGEDQIKYAGRVFDEKEMISILESALDFWLTAGRFAGQFEREFSRFLKIKHCILTNSGSSANLLAISALTSPKLGAGRLKPGDEVITTACNFPTTVNPIIQNNLTPVFVDTDIGTYNIRVDRIEEAMTKKTKAIFLAHTLGNPFDVKEIIKLARKYNLWIIEDNCDGLGSKYCGKYTGTFGHIATFSFYPAHHITMGEGGALTTNDDRLKTIIESFRDWGRDCWCEPGKDNTCGKRFNRRLGELPYGYDHKYIYSHFGYNLKLTEMQAAIGVAQLNKLPSFIRTRRRNWYLLKDGLRDLDDIFILPEPTPNSTPCWFGFILTLRDNVGFTRDEIVKYLEDNKIQTRMLFAGNLTRHPCFNEMRKSGRGYRAASDMQNTDKITNDTFWIGVYPGLSGEMVDYMIAKVRDFVEVHRGVR